MKEDEANRLLQSLLGRKNAEWIQEGGFIRFRAKHDGMLWETACRARENAMVFYARFPFRCREPEKARRVCEEMNRKLIRGALFLGEDSSPVYRCTAELDDVFGAEERIDEALRYSARVMAHVWGRLSGT